jgi:hypothetical protein
MLGLNKYDAKSNQIVLAQIERVEELEILKEQSIRLN